MGTSSSQHSTVRFTDIQWIHHRPLVNDNLQRVTQAELNHLFQHRPTNKFPPDLQHLFIDEQRFQVNQNSIFTLRHHSSLKKHFPQKSNLEFSYQFLLASSFVYFDCNRLPPPSCLHSFEDLSLQKG